MECYIDNIVTYDEISDDIKTLIPDAAMRRRMSNVVKCGVATAIKSLQISNASHIGSIITATGLGCLADSERFLRNIITEKEQLLNPTPFIQSTFNTVGGQIAIITKCHGYNVTYVNRSRSFADAMLDAIIRLTDGDDNTTLVGAFDDVTPTAIHILQRLKVTKQVAPNYGAVFALLTAKRTSQSVARLKQLIIQAEHLSVEQCMTQYASSDNTAIIYNEHQGHDVLPIASAYSMAYGVKLISEGKNEVIIYNEYLGESPTIMILQCVGC